MDALAAILLVFAVVLAVLRALGVDGRVDLGWLAVACLILAVWCLPAVNAV